jgi:hypothetical protein
MVSKLVIIFRYICISSYFLMDALACIVCYMALWGIFWCAVLRSFVILNVSL